jgi:chromate transporter
MSEADREPSADAHRLSGDAQPVGFGRIVAYFLKLGAIGFGGPIATVGYMQRDLVEQRQWMGRFKIKEPYVVVATGVLGILLH